MIFKRFNIPVPLFHVYLLTFVMTFNSCCTSVEEEYSHYARVQMDSFKYTCKCYTLLTGSSPAKLDDLVTDPGNVKNWRQLIEEIPMDPWGNEYRYKIENNLITISSEGSTDSEKDDITISFRTQSKNQ